MFDFITQLIFASALVVMVYLLARALPRIADDAGAVPASAFDKLVDRLPLEQIDGALVSTFEKILRKTRVLVLKLDNAINRYLGHLRKHSPIVREVEGAQLKEKIEAMAEVIGEGKQK